MTALGINGGMFYDPVTGRHASVGSEEQLRAWIEERYYN
jgi:hypothetical protein